VNNTPKRPHRRTQAGKLLEALEDRPTGLCALTILTNFDELGISHRYAAAKLVLVKAGYQITTVHPCPLDYHAHAPGLAFYVLEDHIPYTLF
jgi:hypothetical protein